MEECNIVIKQSSMLNSAICRICLNCGLQESGQELSVFEMTNNICIADKINYVSNIEIKKDDGLPDRICSTCLASLENAYDFKQKCERSDSILQSALQQNEDVKEDEIKVELKEEYECEYLDDSAPLEQEFDEEFVVDKPFKSKAIDLKLECHDCGDIFKSKCKLRVHWKKVHLPAQLTCPRCKRISKTYKAFQTHLNRNLKSCHNAARVRIEGEGKNRIYHCKDCSYFSKNIHSVLTHLSVHTGERPIKCSVCDKMFTQYSSMTSHREKVHKIAVRETTCQYCGKHLLSRSRIYQHMKAHRAVHIECKICFKVLKSKTTHADHMRRHSGVKAFTCEVCAKTFFTLSELSNHKRHIHAAAKVYSCDRCVYKTTNQSRIYSHRKGHTDTNVSCDVCGMFLDNDLQLSIHKSRHFITKNYKCEECEKKFSKRKYLLNHFRKKHKMYVSKIKTDAMLVELNAT